MTDVNRLVGGGFAYMGAPFASHPNDRKRALIYLRAAHAAGLQWADIERQLRDYMEQQKFTETAIEENLQRASALIQAGLDKTDDY